MDSSVTQITVLNDIQLREVIEDAAIARLVGKPALLKASGQQQRIIEVYYKTLAETDDEILALRAAREA